MPYGGLYPVGPPPEDGLDDISRNTFTLARRQPSFLPTFVIPAQAGIHPFLSDPAPVIPSVARNPRPPPPLDSGFRQNDEREGAVRLWRESSLMARTGRVFQNNDVCRALLIDTLAAWYDRQGGIHISALVVRRVRGERLGIGPMGQSDGMAG